MTTNAVMKNNVGLNFRLDKKLMIRYFQRTVCTRWEGSIQPTTSAALNGWIQG